MYSSCEKVLEIKDFSMSYPGERRLILDQLNLTVSPGERLALIGSSGCGKSTIARLILNLLPPDCFYKGKILVAGQDPLTLSDSSLRRLRGESVGLVFQDPMTRLNPLMRVGQHLIDNFEAHDSKGNFEEFTKRSKDLIERVGLSYETFKAYPHELSGGMQQRLGIALAIALNPNLVIADEPTTSLDVAVSERVMEELSNLCQEIGSSLLLITHDLAVAGRWCDRIALLDNGNIVEQDSSEQFLLQPQSKIARRLVGSARQRESFSLNNRLKKELVLEVNCLRSWHSLEVMPWRYKWLKAVDDVSFSIHEGETLGLVGASGCGKSTLCRALMGLVAVRGGEVKLKGENILTLQGNNLKKARRSFQMVFQDPFASLNPQMTVIESISDPFLIHDICSRSQAKENARNLLKQVGLFPIQEFQNRFPYELSGGQQQRVAIARAIALEPKVLICDESVSMLDPEVQQEVLLLLKSLQERFGLAILFITHDLRLASAFCNRVAVLDKGRIVEEGSGQKLFSEPRSLITKTLISACPSLPSISCP